MHESSLNLIILGLGKVGRALVRQVLSQKTALQHKGLRISFQALADSRAMLVGDPLNTDQIQQALVHKENGAGLESLPGTLPLKHLPGLFTAERIIVDTSAARQLDLRPALAAGSRVVFANKNAMSASWTEAQAYYQHSNVAHEATVGAGLPVIHALRSLIATGDRVSQITGVMSGTLGFLCSQLEQGIRYSQAVQAAHNAGYTEPDPRDDLSGFDVARKALILARTAGWPLEMTDLQVESLYDSSLTGLPVNMFFQRMAQMDDSYQAEVESAGQQGRVLRYLATITPEGGRVGLTAIEKSSALGALRGTGNYIAFQTERYHEVPLVIAGPGAGVEVTAAGVFSDILSFAGMDGV